MLYVNIDQNLTNHDKITTKLEFKVSSYGKKEKNPPKYLEIYIYNETTNSVIFFMATKLISSISICDTCVTWDYLKKVGNHYSK